MPLGLRFCRTCGFRLGEGVAEYTETVRFSNSTTPNPFGMGAGQMAPAVTSLPVCRKKRMSGMTWIFVGMIVFFLFAGIISHLVRPRGIRGPFGPPPPPAAPAAPRSYLGVDLDTNDDGVTFSSIQTPGSPLDKAGLVGGDTITSFDGKPVKTDDELMDLLRATPVGKTVEVVYLRDGKPLTTKLTTISESELAQLGKAFAGRAEGKGRLGISGQDEVEIPELGIRGVKLERVDSSMPADMAGLKSGDIVIEFGGAPIRTGAEFSNRILRAIPYDPPVDVVVIRGSERLKIPVRMGKK